MGLPDHVCVRHGAFCCCAPHAMVSYSLRCPLLVAGECGRDIYGLSRSTRNSSPSLWNCESDIHIDLYKNIYFAY